MSKHHHHHTQDHAHETRDLTALAEDAQALMTATADVAGEKVAQARKRLSDGLDAVRQKTAETISFADEAVHENPYKAVGIALGVGVLVGLLLSRRSSREK